MSINMNYRGAIFDLDGVIVDTAKFHFMAWHKIAEELGFQFKSEDNERLKGVSRMRSLEILLEIGGLTLDENEKRTIAEKKNQLYLEMLVDLSPEDTFVGVKEFILFLRRLGIKIALGSASKNAKYILQKLDILNLFDEIVDGTMTTEGKPNPEVFLLGAKLLDLNPHACVVFEDALAGIEAANRCGMYSVGIGDSQSLKAAQKLIHDFSNWKDLTSLFNN